MNKNHPGFSRGGVCGCVEGVSVYYHHATLALGVVLLFTSKYVWPAVDGRIGWIPGCWGVD